MHNHNTQLTYNHKPTLIIKTKKLITPPTDTNYTNKFTYNYKYLTQAVDIFIDGYTYIFDLILQDTLTGLQLPHTNLHLQKSIFTDKIKDYLKQKKLIFKHPWRIWRKKPISETQWNKFENSIANFLKEAANYIIDPAISLAFVMGKLLAKLEHTGKTAKTKNIEDMIDSTQTTRIFNQYADGKKPKDLDPLEARTLEFAHASAGRYIKNIAPQLVTSIQQEVANAVVNGNTEHQLANTLFNSFSDVNRDMRRIAAYELVSSHNYGQIMSTLDLNKEAGVEKTYMELNNLPGACDWCQEWHRVPVLVLEEPPANGDEVVDEYTDFVIWPGKNNVGRKRKDWWLSMSAQHPHCNCFWTVWHPPRKKGA